MKAKAKVKGTRSYRQWKPGRDEIKYALLTACLLALVYANIQLPSHLVRPVRPGDEEWSRRLDNFWWELAVRLKAAEPLCGETKGETVAETKAKYTSSSFPELTPMNGTQLACLQRSHVAFVKDLHSVKPPYVSGSRGIVTTANFRYLRIFLVSLRMLRKTGCELPVEVFLSGKKDHDPYLCNVVLPSLGASCLLLDERIPQDFDWHLFTQDGEVHKFQYKILAMLFSSFEDLIFLDADNVPLQDPEGLFSTELYRKNGAILWPDAWTPTSSPSFFKIQNRPLPLFFERLTIEAGQLVWSKSRRAEALLLAAYYTFFGPKHYFWLLAQGAMGMGDKDTFLPALTFFEPRDNYASANMFQLAGFYEGTHYWNAGGVHFWPAAVRDKTPKPLFLHASWPKLDAAEILLPRSDALAVIHDNGKGQHHRIWPGMQDALQADAEMEIWKELEFIACKLAPRMLSWPADRSPEQVCALVTKHRRELGW